MEQQQGNPWLGAGIGGVVGGLTGYLTAPRVSDAYHNYETERVVDPIRRRTNGVLDELKSFIEENPDNWFEKERGINLRDIVGRDVEEVANAMEKVRVRTNYAKGLYQLGLPITSALIGSMITSNTNK